MFFLQSSRCDSNEQSCLKTTGLYNDLKKKKEIHAIGAEVWVMQPSGPPTPADVIAQGKDNTVLVMIPRQEKYAI